MEVTMSGKSLLSLYLFILLSRYMKTGFGFSLRSSEVDVNIKCIERERQALLKIKEKLVDEYDHLASWGNEEHKKDCCEWRGVSCSNRTGHVLSLNLHFSSWYDKPLRGNISASLLELQYLNYLNLSENDFGGQQIPEFVGSLTYLRHLDLSDANFSGRVPYQLGNLSRLKSLDLSYNYDMYAKLEWLSHLSSLNKLALNSVNLSEATDWLQVVSGLPSLRDLQLTYCYLPAVLTSSTSFINSSKSLASVDMAWNNLSDSIYPWLFHYSSSRVYLDLDSTNLQGSILNAFCNMTSLMYLYLSENQIDGVPICFGNFRGLKRLDLSNNNLQGSAPNALCNMTSLMNLDLSRNQIDSVPICFGNFYELGTLDLSYNNLKGSALNALCNMTSLMNLNLIRNQIDGVPRCFRNFCRLRELSLSSNKITGPLTVLFFNLSGCTGDNLEILSLYNNSLTGPCPDFTGFSSTKDLDISYNPLNMTITKSIGQLSKLESLNAYSSSLKGIITEAHMSNLSRLTYMDLSFNSLTLNFNKDWTPPFRLQHIILSGCKLGPNFPNWLQTQSVVSFIDISNAGISDTIPNWFWDIPMLSYLNLSHNELSGTLPNLSTKFSTFIRIDLSYNCFEGSIPSFPSNVTSLNLSNNKLSGSIFFLCEIIGKILDYLDLSNNRISGEMPNCFMRWHQLEVLNLASNNFSGRIPNNMKSNCRIWAIDLHNNILSGNLPISLKNCKALAIIDMGNNKLSGTIPTWIGDSLPNLVAFSLRSNQFHGTMPIQVCDLSKVQILDFSYNNIEGTLPNCFNNFSAMVQKASPSAAIESSLFINVGDVFMAVIDSYQGQIFLVWKGTYSQFKSTIGLVKSIDFSSNKLSGNIPKEITSLIGLISLNQSRNNLNGSIPKEIGKLKLLNSLDLSKNLLTGDIPERFSHLDSLGVLNLSNNNLSGKIPSSTKPQSFSASSYIGNPNLCGSPLSNICPRDKPTQDPAITISDNGDGLITQGFYVSIILGFIIGFWGVCGTLVLNKSWRFAYFQFLKDMKDKLYILVAVNMIKFQRKL